MASKEGAGGLLARMRAVPDPRKGNHTLHAACDMLAASLVAVMCGYDSYRLFAGFAEHNLGWLRSRGFAFANGVPSHDAFPRLFKLLDPGILSSCLRAVAQDMRAKLPFEVVAVDGKASRRAKARGGKTPFIVNAWADAHGIVLGEVKVDEKSNEITAIPKLLRMLDLEGCIVTIDAAGCQKKIMRQIVEECKADCVLSLKDNQRTLHEEMLLLFESELAASPHLFRKFEASPEKNSGRIERRTCWQTDCVDWFEGRKGWPHLRSVIMVEAERTVRDPETGEWGTSTERRLYISSLAVDPERALGATRRHWGVESMHWTLDVVYGEDYSRARTKHAAENRATVRRIALSVNNRWRRKRKCGSRDAMLAASQSLQARNEMLMPPP